MARMRPLTTPAARLAPSRRLRLCLAMAALALCALVVAPTSAFASFSLGLEDNGFLAAPGSSSSQIAYGALGAVHARSVRLFVPWSTIAPSGASRPAGFDPSDAADGHYNWGALDTAVRTLSSRGDRVLIDLTGSAPAWAVPAGKPSSLHSFPGSWEPDPRQFGMFAHAAAERYSGRFTAAGAVLPRVSQWEIWNEENLPEDLTAKDLVSEYRSLLNAAYSGIKSTGGGETVGIGGFAPVSFINHVSISPLTFAAKLLCLRRVGTHFVRAGSCPVKAHFDALAVHPYSLLATPTKHAYRYDDVLVGDMGKVKTLLQAARKLHTAASGSHFALWVTEWSWFSNPPDKQIGDAPAVAARYTAYSMYEMWRAGTSLVVWFLIRDPQNIGTNSPDLAYGGGLEDSSGREKPMGQAFAFPVIASVSRGRGYVWGRAPVSGRTRVIVERRSGGGWKAVGTTRSGSDGVFQLRFGASANGTYRARLASGAVSLGYDSRPIPAVRTHT